MRRAAQNLRLALGLAAVVVAMLGASFAAVPFYDWFCRVTGYGGATGVAEAPPDEALDRVVTVRFDANVQPGMPWEFHPVQRTMRVRLGDSGLAFFEAYNPTGGPVAGQASYNVTPYAAGGYFAKVACFCFELQVLGPGERVQMPVSFFIDPAMIEDAEARHVTDITLSYTMHRAELPEEDLASAAPAARGQTVER